LEKKNVLVEERGVKEIAGEYFVITFIFQKLLI
jgi:hypothetical protein